MFESLTRFIPAMDRKESVFSGHPSLFDELYRLADERKEYRLHEYGKVLEEYGLKWDERDLRAADVSEMDAQGVVAVLFGACRADHFCEGAFDDFAKDGYVSKWLKRLKELDEEAAMGMSFATLSLYGAERSALEAALAPGDLLRDRNLPWLTLVPAQEEEGDFPLRLEKAARRLTKGSDAVALLFFYYDDDAFVCRLYRNGRRAASCHSDESWAKLGKQLDELFGDTSASKAFRYASRCSSLEEKLALLEETVGAALYDVPEEDAPRAVPRCDATLRAVKARESMLRKRPKQFVLTELAEESWPEEMKIMQTVFRLLRPQWWNCELSTLLYHPDPRRYMVPGDMGLFAYPYIDFHPPYNVDQSCEPFPKFLFLYNAETGAQQTLGPFANRVRRIIRRTKSGDPVMLSDGLPKVYRVRSRELGLSVLPAVTCLGEDGTARWSFSTEVSVGSFHAAPDGVITLFGRAANDSAAIIQIDGETGEMLRTRHFPPEERMREMIYAEPIGALVCRSDASGELVVLDNSLEEVRRMPDSGFSCVSEFHGNCLWNLYYSPPSIRFLDLSDGSVHSTPLEIPVFPTNVLPDGRILGVNGKQDRLTVFDQNGTMVSRCSVPGTLCFSFISGGEVFLAEMRGLDKYGWLCDELFDEASAHVWRLDPAPKK